MNLPGLKALLDAVTAADEAAAHRTILAHPDDEQQLRDAITQAAGELGVPADRWLDRIVVNRLVQRGHALLLDSRPIPFT